MLFCETAQSEKIKSSKFWQLINNVKVQLPYGLEQVNNLFDNSFVLQTENDVFITYEIKDLMLIDEVNIENIEARVFRKKA